MPFYEYECSNCKFYSEVMQKISDAPLTKCPSCGKKALKKLVSAPNFRLKGGGWYETDFKGDKENKRNLAGGDKDDSSPSTPEALPTPASKADASKTEASKTETSKTDSASGEASKKASGSNGADSKSSSSSRGSSNGGGGRSSAKAPARKPAPSKSRSAPARSKAKPAARKKARR